MGIQTGTGGEKVHDHEEPKEKLPQNVMRAPHDQGGGYMFTSQQLIVGKDDKELVAENLNLFVERNTGERRSATYRERSVKASDSVIFELEDQGIAATDLPALVAQLRNPDLNGADRPIAAAPQHVLFAGSHPDPFPVSAPYSARATEITGLAENAPGHGVKVAVLDSGAFGEHPQLRGKVDVRPDRDKEDQPAKGGTLDHFSGHGTFIAGVVLQHAPAAKVVARRVFGGTGNFTDQDLSEAIRDLPEDIDIVNLSCGGPTHDNIGLPLTFEALTWLHNRNPNVVVVASAGNDAVDIPYFPAAFKNVIGVAALGPDGKRACFSNYGWWVDACADGTDVLSTFLEFEGQIPAIRARTGCPPARAGGDQTFEGWARWSGTSFAAPRVAGAIAARMTEGRRLSAAEAAFQLLRTQSLLVDGTHALGVVIEPASLAFEG